MRIEANTPIGRKTRAYLNGQLMPFVTWADDETGEMEVIPMVNNRAKMDEEGKLVRELLSGVVTFKEI